MKIKRINYTIYITDVALENGLIYHLRTPYFRRPSAMMPFFTAEGYFNSPQCPIGCLQKPETAKPIPLWPPMKALIHQVRSKNMWNDGHEWNLQLAAA